MADTEQATTEPKTKTNTKTSMLARFLIAAFMGSVVAAECLFAYFWLPSASEVAAQMGQIAEDAKASVEADQEHGKGEAETTVEVDLGSFTITNHRLLSEATIRTDFHLYGTVAEKEREEFATLFARNEKRFRDQVITEIRVCEVNDLEDPGLGLIKRRFLEKSNTLLGIPLLRSVIFADYTFVEL
jgi:flagellar FliL protein